MNESQAVTVHSPAEKRSSAISNTLRDAQKRQKTPFRAVYPANSNIALLIVAWLCQKQVIPARSKFKYDKYNGSRIQVHRG